MYAFFSSEYIFWKIFGFYKGVQMFKKISKQVGQIVKIVLRSVHFEYFLKELQTQRHKDTKKLGVPL